MDKAIAIYLRLSVADGDLGRGNKDKSNSIENQRQLLMSYIDDREDLFGEVRQYIDDGYTGTNFNRPGFMQMLEDAKAGRVGCIVVKDLSRLGRDYIGVGDYVEQIFPMLGVRFIAVNNNLDSDTLLAAGTSPGLDFEMTNLVNNLYSYDISKKIRSSNRVKWKQGIATCHSVPFGYCWDKNSTQRGVIDPVASKYVRMVFDFALKGYNTSAIAAMMNEEKIPTPGVYAGMTGKAFADKSVSPDREKLWDPPMVSAMLKRYEYTGALVMNRRKYIGVATNVSRKNDIKDWIVAENAHEAIVTRDEFDEAQNVIRTASDRGYIVRYRYPLKGVLRCGNCKRMLTYEEHTGEGWFYCAHKAAVGKYSQCYAGQYREALINARVACAIRDMIDTRQFIVEKRQSWDIPDTVEITFPNEDKLMHSMEVLKEERIRQYESYADGVISKDVYIRKKQELTEKIDKIRDEIQRIEDLLAKEEDDVLDGIAVKASEVVCNRTLTRRMVEAFIEVVYLYDGDRMEIVFKNSDALSEAVDDFFIDAGLYRDEDGNWIYPETAELEIIG